MIDGIRLLDYSDRSTVDKRLHLTEARIVATAAPLLEVSAACMCCLLLACEPGRGWDSSQFAVNMQTLCKLHGSAGIAHMDVKPENILLAPVEDNAWNKLCLVDFGLSAQSGTAAHNRMSHFS